MSVPTVLRPRWNAAPTTFAHSWEGFGNVDQFRWFVRKDMLDQLARCRDELGLKHVRAVGMFDDELRVLCKDPTRWRDQDKDVPRTNWQLVDYCIRSLREIGVEPMFTTCFMPSVMADGETTVFSTKARTSPPKDWNAWSRLVSESVTHAQKMWGKEITRKWYYEVWNEPNLMGGFWGGDKEQFMRLWSTTWRAIKKVDPELRVGGPSTARGEWVADLIEFARKDGTPPDYIITHCYNNDSESKPLSPFDGAQEDRINLSPNFLAGVVRGTRKMLDSVGVTGEVHWNEWGRSWFPCDPDREGPLEAAYVVRTMAEVSQCADRFAYWCLSDIYDQVGYGAEAFHGNYGLLNLHGLRKAPYHAFQLLGRLGTQRVPVEGGGEGGWDGAIATVDGGKRMLVYRHPTAFANVPTSGRISIYTDERPLSPRLYRVDRTDHNIVANWRELGAPAYIDQQQLAHLQSLNILHLSHDGITCEADGSGWRLSFALECPGVALVEL